MNETRLGNHPENVLAWARVGRAMSEDKFVPGSGRTNTSEVPIEDRIYGKQKAAE